MKTILMGSAAVLVLQPVIAFAQAAPPETVVVVSATRAPVPLEQTGSSVSVIDRVALDRLQSVPAVDVLRTVPGVSFSRNGGVGSVTSVRIRGAEADQTVTLIDGVKVNDPSSPGGGFNFANLLTGGIERIEVLRGPQSTLYGSQAIGGVIAITTRDGQGPLQMEVAAETGDLATRQVRAHASAGRGRARWAVSAGRFQSDGISAFDQALGGREADSYENTGVTGRLSLDLHAGFGVDARFSWTSADAGIDGFPAPSFSFADTLERSKTDEVTASLGVTFTGRDNRFRGRLGLNTARIDRRNTDPVVTPEITFDARGLTDRLDGQFTFDATPALQLIAGMEVETAEYRTRSPSVFDPAPPASTASNTLHAVFLQAQATPVQGLTATLGVRASDNDRFGTALNLRATLAWALNGGDTIVRASVGDGFKAPTLFQLFSDFGNIRLRPEEATAMDASIEQHLFGGRLNVSATVFSRDTVNQIDFASCFASSNAACANRPFGVYDNIARARAEGVELTAEARLWRGFHLAANLTDMRAQNLSPGPGQGRSLPRRADRILNLDLGYRWQAGHDLSVSVSDTGDSFDNAANTRRLDGYTLVTARGELRLNPRLSLFARIENATDAAYQTVSFYGSPGRQAFVGVRARL